jgi:hypothetical protein
LLCNTCQLVGWFTKILVAPVEQQENSSEYRDNQGEIYCGTNSPSLVVFHRDPLDI